MSEVNEQQNYLSQSMEQDFQDDVNSLNTQVSNRALNLVTFHKKSIPFNRLD